MTQRPYRLGLDIGSNSIGWFILWLDTTKASWRPEGLGPGGVRIFPDGRDPQSGTSNAVDRRMAKGARRRRDRFVRRQRDLLDVLVRHGLMPEDKAARKALESLDPYELRARGLDGALPLHHFGRALFHLNQRRGFKSNRKSDAKSNEKGVIKEATTKLQSAMADEAARTLGEFLWRRQRERQPVRVRNRGTSTKIVYDFYPTRALLEQEFDQLWTAQARHHTELTDALRDELRDIIFFQRPLRSPPIGKCVLDPATDKDDRDGFRAPWALPLAQRFRILQEVRNLAIAETGKPSRPLSKEQGDKVLQALLQTNSQSFDKLRALLGLSSEVRFNLESEKRQELKGDETAARLSKKGLFGKTWRSYPPERRAEIVEKLLDESLPDEALVAWLMESCDLDSETAERIAASGLPEGYCRLGRRALAKLVPLMEQGSRYDEAATAVYRDHAKLPTGEILDALPYYGEWLQDAVVGSGDPRFAGERRWGRISNPTVHIGLNQLRRVVNSIAKHYGPPAEIVVELARELKLSLKDKQQKEKEQAENQKKNDARRQLLQEQGQPATATNLLKLRLWEELNPRDPLDRRCPFTGEQISLARLLSEEVEIEHLAPFALSWDDSAANKVVCMRFANRAKGKRFPFDAFGGSPILDGHRYDWEEIAQRANTLPRNKRWRFAPDAAERYAGMGGFLARQLTETGWLGRLAKQYLTAICNPHKVWVIPGQLTALLRGKWGLHFLLPDHNFSDAKNRLDHRHHAIDACVAGLTDRSLLQRMASAYDEERDRIVVPEPWEGFRDELKTRLDAITVSYKPDHGHEGALHEDTAYGLVKHPEREDGNLVYRKAFTTLTDNEINRIRDRRLRAQVRGFVDQKIAEGMKLPDALAAFAARRHDPHTKDGLRHVRLLKLENAEYLASIQDCRGSPYKAYSTGRNLYTEIFELPDGTWQGEVVTVFQANQDGYKTKWPERHPGARLVMRIYKGDLISLERNGSRCVMVARRLEPSAKRIRLAPHNEAGNLEARHKVKDDPFTWLFGSYATLKEMNAYQVRVDELGRVWRHSPLAQR